MGRGRVIVEGQRIHASVAFKQCDYLPKAKGATDDIPWKSLIGKGLTEQGTVEDISWAHNFHNLLDMDLFDPSYVEEIIRQFKNLSDLDKAKEDNLRRLSFMALSCESFINKYQLR